MFLLRITRLALENFGASPHHFSAVPGDYYKLQIPRNLVISCSVTGLYANHAWRGV